MVAPGDLENYLVKTEPQMVTLLRGLHHFSDTDTPSIKMLSLNGQQKPNILFFLKKRKYISKARPTDWGAQGPLTPRSEV